MKALGLIIVGFFCILPIHGEECEMTMLTYNDWLSSEETQPFQTQAFQSNIQQEEMTLFAAASSNSDEYTELGGLERELDIKDGTFILLLLSLGYCFKRYREVQKIR